MIETLRPLVLSAPRWAACVLVAFSSGSEDWPMWGYDASRSMSCDERGLPDDFAPGRFIGASNDIDAATSRRLRWMARLGSESYGNPTVAGGRVFVGTNNDVPRDARFQGDRSCVYCFDEADGSFLWQLVVPKLGTGTVSDWDRVGICSSPSVEGERVYLVSNRCEVLCLDVDGMDDGNDGPFVDEARYQAGPGAEPIPTTERDADIVWILDMMEACGVRPHNITSSSVLVAGDRLWVTTSNGASVGHDSIPAPDAPSLILVDKKTGKLVAEEASGLSSRMLHASWTSPAYLRTAQREMCIFGGPDGFCYAFSPTPVEAQDGRSVLSELWRVDCNPADYRRKEGEAIPYGDRHGPSEILGTPIVHDERVYCVIGQEPGHGEGAGSLTCIDAAGKALWSYREINRSMSTPAAADGLVFAADYSGFVVCLDAKSGEAYWTHDTMGHIWGSPLVADGKVYIGTEDGYLTILRAGKEYDQKQVVELDMAAPLYSSPIAANGVLYVATQSHLFAFEEREE